MNTYRTTRSKTRATLILALAAQACVDPSALDQERIAIDDQLGFDTEEPSDGGSEDSDGGDPTPTSPAERQAEVEEFLAQRELRLEPVASTTMPSGQVIDWVPAHIINHGIELEVPNIPVPQPDMGGPLPETMKYPELYGPEGTVPVVRPDFSSYIEDPQGASSLLEFGIKPAPDANNRYYQNYRDTTDNHGTLAAMNLWDQSANVPHRDMALLQNAVLCWSPSLQGLEAGVQVNTSNYPDGLNHLFVFFRTNGSAQGDDIGGYAEVFDGWYQNPSATFGPGAVVSGPYSTIGGSQYEVTTGWYRYGDWWWFYGWGQWVGAYPESFFSTFDAQDAACESRWYGEIFDRPNGVRTNAHIGGGALPSSTTNWGQTAYIRRLQYYDTNGLIQDMDFGNGWNTDPACYSGWVSSFSGVWDNSVWIGGSGSDLLGCI